MTAFDKQRRIHHVRLPSELVLILPIPVSIFDWPILYEDVSQGLHSIIQITLSETRKQREKED